MTRPRPCIDCNMYVEKDANGISFRATHPGVSFPWECPARPGEAHRGSASFDAAVTGQRVRFADFYEVTYDRLDSGARALVIMTDGAMQVRPVSASKIIVART